LDAFEPRLLAGYPVWHLFAAPTDTIFATISRNQPIPHNRPKSANRARLA
jgi:hypothetical protein